MSPALALALVVLGQQSGSSTPADVIGPVVNTVLGFGVLGVGIVLATIGRIDLHPSAAAEREAELKALNLGLLAAITEQNKVTEGAVAALAAVTTELAAVRAEMTDLRVELARRPPPREGWRE